MTVITLVGKSVFHSTIGSSHAILNIESPLATSSTNMSRDSPFQAQQLLTIAGDVMEGIRYAQLPTEYRMMILSIKETRVTTFSKSARGFSLIRFP